MSYLNRFADEPKLNSADAPATEAPQHFTPPAHPGFYWVRLPDLVRVKKDGKTLAKARGHWNGIALVYGMYPYFKMKLWDFAGHVTSFGNAPHLIEYGPKIDEPADLQD